VNRAHSHCDGEWLSSPRRVAAPLHGIGAFEAQAAFLCADNGKMLIRSASRLGESDGDVNKNRIAFIKVPRPCQLLSNQRSSITQQKMGAGEKRCMGSQLARIWLRLAL
jgi:hypothetical protein